MAAKNTMDMDYSELGGGVISRMKPAEVLAFKQETRIQESFSAAAERKLLLWMAKRLPAWVNSDHLTVIGSLGMCLAGISYVLTRWDQRALLLAIVFLFVNWFGDSLDGTLARLRNQQRPRYGFYVDHILDTLGAFCLMGGLAMSGVITPGIAIGILIAFLMLSIEVYLATYTLGKFRLSYGKLGPTEIRIALAIGNLALYFRGDHVLGGRYLLFDVGGIVGIVGMSAMLIISAVRHAMQLYREERLS